MLGNPFSVIRGLQEGVESLFYEPYQGLIQGPGEFLEGVGVGIRSLFGQAVGKFTKILFKTRKTSLILIRWKFEIKVELQVHFQK